MNLHKRTTYNTAEIPNPFREGQDKAYADILADKMREMRWWRGIVGGGVLLLFLASFAFFVYAVSLQKTVPVLINVMPTGEAQYLGEVRQNAGTQVPEAAVLFQIREFITCLRFVPTDPQVLYNNIDKCYSMVTSAYEPAMTRNLRAASPFDLVGRERRSVEIESVIKITGSSYQTDWTETLASASAAQKRTRMRALVTVKLLPVADANTAKKNPLGIYIENCEMTEL
jgi:type IV secretion system protein VirB5